MSNETDRSVDRPDDDEAAQRADRYESPDVDEEQLDTDNVEESVTQGSPQNPAAAIDPDAPGLSALGQQSGPPVEPNEPA